MNYKKQKRDEIDFCNICGERAKLTWDHVPPKCCNNKYSIKANSWMHGIPKENSYDKQYQNGIRFRSLCEKCNNTLMGINYDVALAEFTEQVMQIVMSAIILPTVVNVPIKVNRLARAICGHVLAAKNFYDDSCLIDEQLREYICNTEALPPIDMSLLYWIYPYSTIAIMRDISVKSFSEKYAFPDGVISIMNSFPMAYIISSPKEEKCGLLDLFQYCSNDIDEIVEIPVNGRSCYFPKTNHLRPFLWPCNVSDEDDGASMLLGNNENMNAAKIAKHSRESIQNIRERR